MIEKTDAERIAAAIHALRPDWPLNSLMTLLAELRTWPLRDLAVKLAWIATDQNIDGTPVSQTPARVKENGPWHHLTAIDLEAARTRALADIEIRKQANQARTAAITACHICDHEGRLPEGGLCRHDETPTERALKAKAHADQARQALRRVTAVS